MRIRQRQLSRTTGSEGPRHDPYAYEELTLHQNADTVTLHLGLAVWVKRNGRTVAAIGVKTTEDQVLATFEREAGMSATAFERAWDRVHGMPGTRCPECGGRLTWGSGYVGEAIVLCTAKDCHYGWSEPVSLASIE